MSFNMLSSARLFGLRQRESQLEDFLVSSGLAVSTRQNYRKWLTRFMQQCDKPWAAVTTHDLATFKGWLATQYRTKQGDCLSASSVNAHITALKAFYRWLQDAGHIPAGPKPTDALKMERPPQPLPKHLTPEQVDQLINLCQGESIKSLRDSALLAILMHGLRAEDVSLLNVASYDGERLSFIRKKDRTEALVPLRPSCRQRVDRYLAERSRDCTLLPSAPLLVCVDRKTPGKRLGYYGIYHTVKDWGRAIGIDLHPHCFRHTFASELVSLQVDSYLSRLLLGQSDRTYRRYTVGVALQAAEVAFLSAVSEVDDLSDE
jgi:integrase/recombinase XerD